VSADLHAPRQSTARAKIRPQTTATAISEDLLGVSAAKVYTDRLYQALDLLLPHKEALEKHLQQRLGNLLV
jgi:hypothetical protein